MRSVEIYFLIKRLLEVIGEELGKFEKVEEVGDFF